MRLRTLSFLLMVFAVCVGRAAAQTENLDPPSATAVVVTQPTLTTLDAFDRADGLVVKGLTLAGTLADDNGAGLEVYAVTSENMADHAKARGLALVVRRRDGDAARAYVDEGNLAAMIDAVKALALIDRGSTPMKETRGVYRTGNVAVLNVDNDGGRTAIVRTLAVSPVTGQVTWAAARFRANRLNELVRYLQVAKDSLDKDK